MVAAAVDMRRVVRMGLRDRREERREERRDERQFGRGGGNLQYRMRQKLVSIGDDFWIEDSAGNRAYKVNGKALRLRQTLDIEDPSGRTVVRIQERVMRVRDTMQAEDADGRDFVTVKKAMITPLRERWEISIAGGPTYEVQGNLVDHEYTISAGGNKVAEVSKRWFRIADTYGVEVEPGANVLAVLVGAVCIDEMTHD
jgi:uncharacterized protein YxjI